jgi:lipopolysaccharide/colanic/teichoic acid biosynthesis glycosyltransferase
MSVSLEKSLTGDVHLAAPAVKRGCPRAVEAVAALAALVLLSPVLAVAALAVAVSSRGGVLFRQRRVGRDGREFTLYKLRTMRPGAGGPQVTAGDDARVTAVGRVLRRTKLDELPELWNVVRGDMALVGPRPEVPRYVSLDDPAWRLVLRARPGLTDPVTLRLRNEEALLAGVAGDREHFYLTTLQPFKLKGYAAYLSARSWRADLWVLWQTCRVIVRPGRALPPTAEEIAASLARDTGGE